MSLNSPIDIGDLPPPPVAETIHDLPPPPTEKVEAAAPMEGSADNPIPTDIFGGEGERFKSGFGEDKGIARNLVKRGFVEVRRNPEGDLIARDVKGNWYRDASNFKEHPISWLSANAGKALPLAGSIVGGLSGATGGGLAFGLGAVPGAVAGSTAGAAAGEAAREGVGRMLGTYDGNAIDHARDIATEGLIGATAEMGGQLIGHLPVGKLVGTNTTLDQAISGALNEGMRLGKKGVAKTAEFLTGPSKEAFERLIERPTQVMRNETPEVAYRTAQNAAKEFSDQGEMQNVLIKDARKTFRDKFTGTNTPTEDLVSNHDQFVDYVRPNSDGYGLIEPKELETLKKIKDTGLTNTNSNSINALERQVEEQDAGKLQRFADWLQNNITTFEQARSSPTAGDTRYQAYLRGLYGRVKEKLHKLDPNGLGVADARFSKWADDAQLLGKLDNPAQMEAFTNHLFGKNKSAQQEAARNIIPNSYEDIADIAANRAFDKQGPSGSDMGKRSIGGGVGALMSLQYGGDGPEKYGLAGASLLATSPKAARYVIGNAAKAMEKMYGSQWFKLLKAKPHLVNSIANPKLRSIVSEIMEKSAGQNLQPIFAEDPNEERNPANEPRKSEKQAQDEFIQGN